MGRTDASSAGRRGQGRPGTVDLDPLLSCDHLTKRFGARVAVDDLSFTVAAGECFGLLGPNGAGKTTTIRMVCGLTPPDAGTVTIAGDRPTGLQAQRARSALGYVPQDLALFPTLTLEENLRYWARMQAIPRSEQTARIAEALAVVTLDSRATDRVDAVSGGMQRRLNLAVALLHDPDLLVLDEPTVGIDPQSRASLLERLQELCRAGKAILYTSHQMDEVERICDRVAVIDSGRIVVEGPPADLLAAHDVPDLETLFLQLTGRALRD